MGRSMTTGNGRTVLTTGANSGIGLATVLHLARLGFRSVGSVRSDAKLPRWLVPPPAPEYPSTRCSWMSRRRDGVRP